MSVFGSPARSGARSQGRSDAAGAGAPIDAVWERLCSEAASLAAREPALASLAHAAVLSHGRFEDALGRRIAQKLASSDMDALSLRELCTEAMAQDDRIGAAARADVLAVLNRDPACTALLEPLLYFKGFLALQAQRVSHWFWRAGRRDVARILNMRSAETFSVDIHPGARIGAGVMIDHGTGVVIGETAVVGDDVSILQGVTLGGTGKESGDRHPKIGRGVLIGAGAKVLGAIRIGECCRIGAGAVVLHDAPACKTLAGVPAVVVGDSGCAEPSLSMDHVIAALDGEP